MDFLKGAVEGEVADEAKKQFGQEAESFAEEKLGGVVGDDTAKSIIDAVGNAAGIPQDDAQTQGGAPAQTDS